MNFTIENYKETDRDAIIALWEASVRATHKFLKEEDILFYKSMVESIEFSSFSVYCCFNDQRELIGFLGVAGNKLEMLFLRPDTIGKGVGRALLHFAIETLDVSEVDVNEDNITAASFYRKNGFAEYARTPLDGCNKPYPILKMKLEGK